MTLLRNFARMARLRAQRRTETLLDSLPPEVQKDIGWRWSPNRRQPEAPQLSEWAH